MKKSRSKLNLNRETIGNLNNDRLSEAAGGLPSGRFTYCGSCGTCYCTDFCHTETDCLETYRVC